MRKLSIYIASSVDGYIAKPNDDLGFLSLVEKTGEDYGYADFIADIDTLIIGRKTHDYVVKALGASYYDNGDRDVYVITRSPKVSSGRTTYYDGSLVDLLENLR
ncbi:MAG: dihydrofolate reductase, partial [Sphingobacterium sp.]|nr:dihydrofolate reductase [Sphingobacterium sp.]